MRPHSVTEFAAGVITGAVITASVVFAAPARADASYAYATVYGPAICEVLDDFPSYDGILGIGRGIVSDGLSARQAGEVISMAVMDVCPRHLSLLQGFVSETI